MTPFPSVQSFSALLKQGSRFAKARRSRNRELSFITMEPRLLMTVSIEINYTYDSNNFFNTQAKRDLIQLAANSIANSLNDSLAAITPSGQNSWSVNFPNPSTGNNQVVSNMSVPANTLIIYVGGSTLDDDTEAGEGSTGGFNGTGDANWIDTIRARGETGALQTTPTDYGPWGGAITFDNTGGTNWYFGQSVTGLGSNQTDFLSVAEHEIGHVLGIGTTAVWNAQLSGNTFIGPNAEASYGGPVPTNPARDHWADGVMSNGARAALDPTLIDGTRVLFSPLDFAGLADLGWEVTPTTPSVQVASATASVNDNAGMAQITVTRTGALTPFTVQYATSNGTAIAGTNYTTTTGTLSFGSGETSKTINVPVAAYTTAGVTRTFNVTLSNPSSATLGSQKTTVVTIVNTKNKVAVDFDGDRKTDLGVYRPSTTQYFIPQSTAGLITPYPTFGSPNLGDIPVIGDFDGVGHAQIGFFRPSTAQWFVLGDNGFGHLLGTFGATNLADIPVPGDYDGDGKTDMAVFRPSTAQWFVNTATGGKLMGTFGATNLVDIPAPGDYDGDGKTEMAVFRPSTAQWFGNTSTGGKLLGVFGATNLTDIPAPGDYDGVGRTQLAVFRPSTAQWFANGTNGGHLLRVLGATNYTDVPIETSIGSLVKLGVTGSTGVRASSFGGGSGIKSNTFAAGPILFDTSLASVTTAQKRAKAAWLAALEQLA